MITVTGESGREYSGFDVAAATMMAIELETLAADLKRRGGGFTAHAEAICRAKAAKLRAHADWITEQLDDTTTKGGLA